MLKFIILFASYFLGAVPFSLLLARYVRGIDLRETGSGNIGTTNVYRSLGLGWAVAAFTADAAKGLVPVVLMWAVAGTEEGAAWWIAGAGLAAVLGHMFPVYLGFKGGKGVATSFGAFLFMCPPAALLDLAVWAVLVFGFRIVSLGSLAAALMLPLLVWILADPLAYKLAAVSAALLVIISHRDNIKRLLSGREKPIKPRTT